MSHESKNLVIRNARRHTTLPKAKSLFPTKTITRFHPQTLHSVQSVVEQSPALMQLQRDLEETNFQAISLVSLPAHLMAPSHHPHHQQNGNVTSAITSANGDGIDLNANQTTNGNSSSSSSNGSVAVAGLQLNQPDFIDSTA